MVDTCSLVITPFWLGWLKHDTAMLRSKERGEEALMYAIKNSNLDVFLSESASKLFDVIDNSLLGVYYVLKKNYFGNFQTT